MGIFSGLLSNQGEKSNDFCFIRVPLRKNVLKYGTPKPGFLKLAEVGSLHPDPET